MHFDLFIFIYVSQHYAVSISFKLLNSLLCMYSATVLLYNSNVANVLKCHPWTTLTECRKLQLGWVSSCK